MAAGLALMLAPAMPVAGQTGTAAPQKPPAWTHPKTPYKATVDDPTIFTRTWNVALPLRRNPDYRICDYACHENNYALLNFIRGSQFQRAQKPKH